jgi:hypothetical protein
LRSELAKRIAKHRAPAQVRVAPDAARLELIRLALGLLASEDSASDKELQSRWEAAISRWKAGGKHPLAQHPHAVRCDGFPGCYTVAPIRVLPDYSKRYCFQHVPPDK